MNIFRKKFSIAFTSFSILMSNNIYANDQFNLRVILAPGTAFLAKVCHPTCSGILGVGSSVDLSVKLGEIICVQVKGFLWDHDFYFKLKNKESTEIIAWGSTFHPQLIYSPQLVKIFDENNLSTDMNCRKFYLYKIYEMFPD
ncbi:hypothetical protein ACWNT8_06585 [Pigmentibacter ruber]